MKYFYDTEFHEDGVTIDLISIGIVCEDGREYYAVSSDADYGRVAENSWLMNNVMNSIEYAINSGTVIPVGSCVKNREQIKQDIIDFVGSDSPEFWAWYGAYDHVALCQLFGKMIDLPHNFPMFTRDIRQHWEVKNCPAMPKQEAGNHNALQDALHDQQMYNFLESL